MAFHHRIKPHHHVSIWAVATLSLIVAASFYNAEVAEQIYGQEKSIANSGPSEKTKTFFGDDNKEGKSQELPECTKQRETNTEELEKKYKERDQLTREIPDIESKLGEFIGDPSQYNQEERAAQQKDLDEKKARYEALVKEIGQTPTNQVDQQEASSNDPDSECKAAIVKQQKSQMGTMRAKIKSTLLPTFTQKVDPLVEKVKAQIPNLNAAGVDEVLITRISSYITNIEADSKLLKEFFTRMQSMIDSFTSQSSDDAAYKVMKTQFGDGALHQKASAAADDLVKNFELLQKAVDDIK